MFLALIQIYDIASCRCDRCIDLVTAGDVKEQVKRTARTLIERYNVRSLPELNTLLELYNICIDEVKGVQNGEAYHGLLYGALTDTGQRVGTPFKASRLGEAFG